VAEEPGSERVVASIKSNCRPVTTDVPQQLTRGPTLCSIFMNDLNNTEEHIFSKSADDTKLGGLADTPEDCEAIQRDLDRLERRAEKNLMKLNKEKRKVLHRGRNKPRHQYTLGVNLLEGSSAGEDLGVLVANKLNMNQNRAEKSRPERDERKHPNGGWKAARGTFFSVESRNRRRANRHKAIPQNFYILVHFRHDKFLADKAILILLEKKDQKTSISAVTAHC